MEQEIATQVVGLGGANDFTLWQLFLRADFVVKAVIIILISSSIFSWALIFDKGHRVLEKTIENILICGLESHICVLQSAIDLIKSNFNVYVIADSIQSRGEYDHRMSIERLRDSGATISTTETSIFELCKSSENKNFKSISQIIKRSE